MVFTETDKHPEVGQSPEAKQWRIAFLAGSILVGAVAGIIIVKEMTGLAIGEKPTFPFIGGDID